jgi:hypothetical protein
MIRIAKMAIIGFSLTATTAFAATPGAFTAACCALGACCGMDMPCCP